MLLEARQDFHAVKLDCRNAFPSCFRSKAVKVPCGHYPGWGGVAPEGFSQGEPWASAEFCVSWQEMVEELEQDLSQGGGGWAG